MLLRSFLLILALCAFGGPALALDVAGLRLGAHPDKTRIVIALDNPAAFRAFVLADPVRLVVDLPQFNWRVGTIEKPPGTGIREIRQGPLQPGISRIVIDLDRAALIRGAFLLPRDGNQPDRVVIDLANAAQTAFIKERGKIFGNLSVNESAAAADMPASPVVAGNIGVPAPKPQSPKTPVAAKDKPLIVLDPGHGGEDPGALGGSGLKEKNITLAMARDLKKALEESGRYRVHLTRDKDIFIRLSQRVAIARTKKADLFISLHADSINRSGVRGASIYTLSEKASDAETEKLAARENHADLIGGLDLSEEDEDVANILVNLTMRDTMNQSKFFANKTVSLLKESGIRVLDNPHRFAGFAVLKAPDVPSVLIELGYMSNSQESAMLSKPEYRARIARALMTGVDDYFKATRQ